MKQRGKKFWLYLSIAALILILAVIWIFHKKSGGPGNGMMAGAMLQGEQAEADVVSVSSPVRGDLSLTSGLTGTLESADVVYVYAKASGDVTDVKVKAGDVVEQGQVLFEIDTDQVDTAKNSLDSAAVALEEARSNLNRMQILYDGGDLSEQEYEQYRNNAKTAELQYESAKLAYDRQVEYSVVTAPISGTIESCDAEVYDLVSTNSQLCVISGQGQKKISFYVTERMLQNLSEGDSLTVEKNGKNYEAHVSSVNTMVDSETGLFKVEAQMEDTDEIATGSTVKLELATEKTENAMLIPVDAVYYSGGDAYVYLYQDGTAHMVPVEIGIYDSTYAEVLSGLNEDDLVIETWSSNLYEGATVRLKESGTEEGTAEESTGEESIPEESAAEESPAEENVQESEAGQEG